MFAPPKWLCNGRSTWVKTHVIVGSCIRYRYQKMNSWSQKKWRPKNPMLPILYMKINFKYKTFKPSCLILVALIYLDVCSNFLYASTIFHAVHPTPPRSALLGQQVELLEVKEATRKNPTHGDIRQRWGKKYTPLKTNMSPENQWLEDVFPTKILPFLGTC